jgi:hypothetical protein
MTQVQWEPSGNRFSSGLQESETDPSTRQKACLYTMGEP